MCQGHTKQGKPCRRRTKHVKYCKGHEPKSVSENYSMSDLRNVCKRNKVKGYKNKDREWLESHCFTMRDDI